MKQWLCDGWFRFKSWVLFNYWKRVSNEDYEEQVRLYSLKRREKRAMVAYVNYLDTHPLQKELADFTGSDWYIGTINPDWENRINAKIKEQKENKI